MNWTRRACWQWYRTVQRQLHFSSQSVAGSSVRPLSAENGSGFACECVVVGGGVVGLAVGKHLAEAGREVLLLEQHPKIGMETSSRNSEVIHAGIYYPPGSLKARVCVEGAAMLYEYAKSRHIPHRRLGKLIVASSEAQIPKLRQLEANGSANKVDGLTFLAPNDVRALEPALTAVAALYSPNTGIVDSHSLMEALEADFEQAGGTVFPNTRLKSGRPSSATALSLEVQDVLSHDVSNVNARWLINCAGLHAHAAATALEHMPRDKVPRIWFAKGNYFSLSGRCPFSRLVYPMPEVGGLGTHLTLDLSDRPQAKFGPDVEWLDTQQPESIDYDVQPGRLESMLASVRSYWPGVPVDSLQPSYSGVRAKLSGPGMPASDFVVQTEQEHGVRGLVNLFGIESPGLTSSLALGALVRDLVLQENG